MHDSEILKNISSTKQSYAIALGILIGGAWALFEFYFEANKSLSIEISASQLDNPSTGKRGIYAQVLFSNEGNRHIFIELDEKALTATNISNSEVHYSANYTFRDGSKN